MFNNSFSMIPINEIRWLCWVKFNLLSKIEDASSEMPNNLIELLEENTDVFEILLEKVGLEFKTEYLIAEMPSKKILSSPFEYIFVNIYNADVLGEKLGEKYGDEAHIFYDFVNALLLVNAFSKACKTLVEIEKEAPILHRKKTKQLITDIYQYKKDISILFQGVEIKEFGLDIQFNMKYKLFLRQFKICSDTINDWIKLEKPVLGVLAVLFKGVSKIESKLKNVRVIINDLKECEPGKKYWSQYEKVCVRALNFLFDSSSCKVIVQKRTSDGFERRDAIVPNNQYSGFWKRVFREFDSKNVVFEFKNIEKLNSKDSILQLRTYLSKRTIGRFGFLFSRNIPTDSAVQARKEAYEQNGILILFISDFETRKMLYAKAYLNDFDFILENLKIKFEIEY